MNMTYEELRKSRGSLESLLRGERLLMLVRDELEEGII